MHARFMSLVLLTVAAAGCTQAASPTSPTSAAAVSGATAIKALPFKGSLEGTYSGSGAPPLVSVHVEAGGHATHLGRFTFDSQHVVNFLNLTGAGTAELTAANGDRLTTTLTGVATPQATPGVFFIVETLTVTGGTGRFAGATGQVVVERVTFPIGPANGTTSGSFEGTISLTHGPD